MSLSKYNTKLTAEFLSTHPEDQYFDRKSARIDKTRLAEIIVAFSNANGGVVALGINDKGEFEGVNSVGQEKINELKNTPYDCCIPSPKVIIEDVNIRNIGGEEDKIILFHIEPNFRRVHKTTKDEVFLRVGDRTKKLNHEERLSLEYDKGERFFEEETVDNCTLDDLDDDTVLQYKKALKAEHLDIRDILSARGLLIEKKGQQKLTVAAVLLFAKNPTKFFPNARLRFIRYEGTSAKVGTEMNIIKDTNIEGPIPKIIENAKILIGSQLRDFISLDFETGQFMTIPEYPEFAWQEGIVNALTHRDYSLMGDHIKVIMYDDKLEIISPGKLPNIVNTKNIKEVRYSRNPRIARVLTELQWVRELGEGVKRIYKEMEKAFLDPPIYTEPNFSVVLTLKNNIIMRRIRRDEEMRSIITPQMWKELRYEEKIALQMAYMQRRVTTRDLSERIARSPNTAKKILKSLEDKNLLAWIGTSKNDPNQYYTLNIKGKFEK